MKLLKQQSAELNLHDTHIERGSRETEGTI
jgi:hypothetical protein